MPAKSKFSAEDVIEAAFSIIRSQGWENCSARSIAHALKSSTMPIYSTLKSMNELKEVIAKKATDLLISYQTKVRTGITFLDMGIGYIMFAKLEKHLFRLMFLTESLVTPEGREKYREYSFMVLLEKLSSFEPFKGLSDQQLRDILFKSWIFTHGLAVLLNNSILPDMDEQEIAKFLLDSGMDLLEGVKRREVFYQQDSVVSYLQSLNTRE